MANSIDIAAFERGTDPILPFFTVQQAQSLVELKIDPVLRRRIEELAARCNEGELTEAEQAEYEGYVRANKFVALLQAKVGKLLRESSER